MRTPFVIGVALLWASIAWYLFKFFRNRWNLRRMLPILLEPYTFAMVPPEYKSLFKGEIKPTVTELKSIGKIQIVDTTNALERRMSIDLIETFLRESIPFTATFSHVSGTVSVEVFYDKAYVFIPEAKEMRYKVWGESKIEAELARRISQSSGAILLQTKFEY